MILNKEDKLTWLGNHLWKIGCAKFLFDFFALSMFNIKCIFFLQVNFKILFRLCQAVLDIIDFTEDFLQSLLLLTRLGNHQAEVILRPYKLFLNFAVLIFDFLNQLVRIFYDIFGLGIFLLKQSLFENFVLLFECDQVTLNFIDQIFMRWQLL